MDALKLLTRDFDGWLRDRTSHQKGARISQGVKLDVFATSMRDSKPITAHLRQIEGAGTVIHSDPTQRITDLNATGLVERTTPAQGRLTQFGTHVLAEWEHLGVDNERPECELARQVVLIDGGITFRQPNYLDAYSFWQEMLDLHPATAWFRAPIALYMVSYLNASAQGFTPWRTLHASGADVTGVSESAWQGWASGVKCVPVGWSKHPRHTLFDAASAAAKRYVGRVTFCMGLEARRLADPGVDLASELSTWMVPYA